MEQDDEAQAEVQAIARPDELELFRLLAENSRDVMLVARMDRAEWVSPSVTELLGFPPSEFLELGPDDLFHPDDWPRVTASAEIMARDGVDQARIRLRHRDGSWRWFEARSRVVPDHDGEVTDLVVSTWRDLHDQVQLEEALQDSERRHRLLMESASDHVAVVHGTDRVEWFTGGDGRERQSLGDPFELVHPEDRAVARAALALARREGGLDEPVQLRVLDGDEGFRWMAVVARDLGPDPETGGTLIALRDVDDQVRAHLALMESERRYRLLAENATDAVARTKGGRFVWISPSVEAMSGWRPDQVIGRAVTEFVHPDDLAHLASLRAWRREEPDTLIVAELRFRDADGEHHWVELRARPYLDEEGERDGNAVSLRRIDREVAARQELERRARFDEVTGLMNRTEVLARLEDLPRRVRRSGTEIAVMFCDVDSLKAVNDVHGHLAGDHLLRTVADRVVASVRADDLVARIGGDELLVVLDGVHDLAQAVEVAEKVRASVARPVDLAETDAGDAEVTPTLSIGVALARPGDGTDDLVARADAAMYRAKRAGRDRVAAAPD